MFIKFVSQVLIVHYLLMDKQARERVIQ